MKNSINYDIVVEAALLASPQPLGMDALGKLFNGTLKPNQIREVLANLTKFWEARGLRLVQTAQGWSFQTTPAMNVFLARLSDQKPPKYSRAVMETLAIIAYRQPATRGDIEEIRGVAVNPNVLRQLEERGWIEEVGRRDTPGRPTLFGTTQTFLDDLGLKSLSDLPVLPGALPEVREFELNFPDPVNADGKEHLEDSVPSNTTGAASAAQH